MGLLSPEAKTLLDANAAVMAYLVELDFTTGIERYSSLPWTLFYESVDWTGVGGLGRIGAVESNDDIRPKELQLDLLGFPVEMLQNGTLRAPQYKGRPARWIFALIDPEAASGSQVVYAKTMHYYIDTVDYAVTPEGGGCRVTLEHESTYAARQSVRRYSDQDQQARHPGDKFFEFLAYLASGRSIRWGASGRFFVD